MNATQTKSPPVSESSSPAEKLSRNGSARALVYRVAAWLSVAVFLSFIGAGIFYAFRTEGRPPRVNLNYVTEINKLLSADNPTGYPQAVSQMRRAVTIDPQSRLSLLEEMHRVAVGRGDVDSQIFSLQELIKFHASGATPDLYVDLALAQLAKQRETAKDGKWSEALAEEVQKNCRKALEIDSSYAVASYIIADVWWMLGGEQSAEQSFRETVKLVTTTDGGGIQSLVRLAKAAEAKGDRHTRVLALRKIAQLPSGVDAMAYNDLASALLDLQNERRNADEIAESIYWSRRAILFDPNFAQSYCNLGGAFLLVGQNDAAAENFRKACALDPNLEPAKQGLAYVEQQLKNAGKASQ